MALPNIFRRRTPHEIGRDGPPHEAVVAAYGLGKNKPEVNADVVAGAVSGFRAGNPANLSRILNERLRDDTLPAGALLAAIERGLEVKHLETVLHGGCAANRLLFDRAVESALENTPEPPLHVRRTLAGAGATVCAMPMTLALFSRDGVITQERVREELRDVATEDRRELLDNALLEAVQRHNKRTSLSFLVEAGANPRAQGSLCLAIAARERTMDDMVFLARLGADYGEAIATAHDAGWTEARNALAACQQVHEIRPAQVRIESRLRDAFGVGLETGHAAPVLMPDKGPRHRP